jgi:hypothetical protein
MPAIAANTEAALLPPKRCATKATAAVAIKLSIAIVVDIVCPSMFLRKPLEEIVATDDR